VPARDVIQRRHPELEAAVPAVVERLLRHDLVQEELDKRRLKVAESEYAEAPENPRYT